MEEMDTAVAVMGKVVAATVKEVVVMATEAAGVVAVATAMMDLDLEVVVMATEAAA